LLNHSPAWPLSPPVTIPRARNTPQPSTKPLPSCNTPTHARPASPHPPSWPPQDMEAARGCWRHLRTLFQELEECRAFELLKGQADRVNYLSTCQVGGGGGWPARATRARGGVWAWGGAALRGGLGPGWPAARVSACCHGLISLDASAARSTRPQVCAHTRTHTHTHTHSHTHTLTHSHTLHNTQL
jgi:hypothetical protein